MKRIGIPRSFYYYHYPGLWESFFSELGFDPILSGPSTRKTVSIASSVTEAEHCLPNKLFDGHVESLKPKVDMIFIPRIISMVKGHNACPKFGALPEATRDGVARDIPVLSMLINETQEPLRRSLLKLAGKLGISRYRAVKAVRKAFEVMRLEEQAIRSVARESFDGSRFLILGHPYTLRDAFIADPIMRKLKSLGVKAEPVTFEERHFKATDILWCSFRKMHDYLQDPDIGRFAGIIQISTFNCGADSMMIEHFRRICGHKDIPYMVIMVDEHSSQAGVDTRLEAFVDSLAWKENGHV